MSNIFQHFFENESIELCFKEFKLLKCVEIIANMNSFGD
jgi:hypothetical protein